MSGGQPETEIIQPSRLRKLIRLNQVRRALTLRGAVVECWERGRRLRVVLRDADYRTSYAAEIDVPLPAVKPVRGEVIEAYGELAEEEGSRNRYQKVLVGTARRVHDKAEGLLRRERHAQDVRERVGRRRALPTGCCDKFHVVTSRYGRALGDIDAELSDLSGEPQRLPQPQLMSCNLSRDVSIVRALRALRERVTRTDVVLIARGGGDREWLDHFEEEDVVTALAELAERCPTYTAIGHAEDTLMLEGIVHGMFATPSAAIGGLHRQLQTLCKQRVQRPAEVSTERGAAWESVKPAPEPAHPSSASAEARGAHAPFPPPTPRAVGQRPVADTVNPPAPPPSRPARPFSTPLPSAQTPRAKEARAEPPRQAAPPVKRVSRDMLLTSGVIGVVALLAGGLWLAEGAYPSITQLQPASALERREVVQSEPPDEPARRGPTASLKERKDRSRAPSTSSIHAPITPLPPPVVSTSTKAVSPELAAQGEPVEAVTSEARRLVSSLLAPFEMGRDLAAARANCSARHGMWIVGASARCRLPGGREYQFDLAGGLVDTVTLRQLGQSPVPLLSALEQASLQSLAASGRGPWVLTVSPQQLKVRTRVRHPGL